jgi:hypothetical protein
MSPLAQAVWEVVAMVGGRQMFAPEQQILEAARVAHIVYCLERVMVLQAALAS